MKPEDLISFEKRIIDMWENGDLPYLIHLSGGNEQQLIDIFRAIDKDDYVLSTHRNHYHYLLHGGSPDRLESFMLFRLNNKYVSHFGFGVLLITEQNITLIRNTAAPFALDFGHCSDIELGHHKRSSTTSIDSW